VPCKNLAPVTPLDQDQLLNSFSWKMINRVVGMDMGVCLCVYVCVNVLVLDSLTNW